MKTNYLNNISTLLFLLLWHPVRQKKPQSIGSRNFQSGNKLTPISELYLRKAALQITIDPEKIPKMTGFGGVR